MPHSLDPFRKKHALSFEQLFKPCKDTMIGMSPLKSQCNRPLKMSFEDHLRALVFFTLKSTNQHSIFCKYSKKMISLVMR